MFWLASSFQPHRHPRIVRVHLRIATQQLFRLFRNHFRQNYLHLNKLIAMRVRVAQAGRAPPPQAKLLSRLRTRRNSQLRFAGNRGHFYFRAQRRFGHGQRNGDVDVVAFAREILVPAHVGDDEQIARRGAHASALALTGNADARARVDAGRNAPLNRFGFWQSAFALAQRARRAPLAGATAIRTLLRKAQTAARALSLPRAFAGGTHHRRSAGIAGAMPPRALFRSIHGQVGGESGNRFFESERERHFNIRAALRLWARRLALNSSAAEQIGKDVAEAAAATG